MSLITAIHSIVGWVIRQRRCTDCHGGDKEPATTSTSKPKTWGAAEGLQERASFVEKIERQQYQPPTTEMEWLDHLNDMAPDDTQHKFGLPEGFVDGDVFVLAGGDICDWIKIDAEHAVDLEVMD